MAHQVVAVTAEELTGEQALERADHWAPRHSHTTCTVKVETCNLTVATSQLEGTDLSLSMPWSVVFPPATKQCAMPCVQINSATCTACRGVYVP